MDERRPLLFPRSYAPRAWASASSSPSNCALPSGVIVAATPSASARSATTRMMTCDWAGARQTTGRSSSMVAGAAAWPTDSGSIAAGSATNVSSGSATNVSSGAATNVSSGAATNVSSGAATNVSSGAATNVSSGAATNVSSGAATNVSSG